MGEFLHYLTFPYLLAGAVVAVELLAGAMAGGVVVGFFLALAASARPLWLRLPVQGYIYTIRGTPMLLQLILLFNVLPQAGIRLSAFESALLALTINETAFCAEIIRGGIGAVDRSQRLACEAFGFSRSAEMIHVVIPQALRAITPTLGNEAVGLLKSTSLASVVGVNELTLRSQTIVSQNFEFLPVLLASGVMYIVLSSLLAGGQWWMERRFGLDRRARRALRRGAADAGPRGTAPPPVAPPAAATSAAPAPGTQAVWTQAPGRPAQATATPGTPAPGTAAPGTAAPERPAPGTLLPGIPPRGAAPAAPAGGIALALRAVRASYGGVPVLREISTTIRAGEVIALMGRSGSGKSTLLKAILALVPLAAGEILVSGRPIGGTPAGRRMPAGRLRQARAAARVGFVFQNFALFDHLTALQNAMTIPRLVQRLPRAEARLRAREALARVGLAAFADRLPHELSGGQQQRVGIARALAGRPEIMLFDEPTSALDPELVEEVNQTVRALAHGGITMLISTHDVGFARSVADRVCFLHEGRIVEDCTPEQLRQPRSAEFAAFLRHVAARETAPAGPGA
jgi:polar amino acid transport system permease protein